MADENVNVEQQNETPKEIAVYKGDDIRDKKLVDAESATTAQSGDSVVLKTTAGTYVEIDRDSFAEVMREELGRLIKGTADKGTSINSVAAMDASNDLGWISPTNLASVLGGRLMPVSNIINADYDSLRTGIAYVSTGTYGLSYGIYIGCFRDSVVGAQFFIQGTEGLYTRNHGSSGWSEWLHIVP